MPFAQINGVSIHYEATGTGPPLVFSHEFAGDSRSWKPQVEAFAGEYRCITWNYRGYPPSDVPEDPEQYSQEILVEDLRALLDHLEIEQAHIAGLSMGGSIALVFALTYPERCLSTIIAGAGSGSVNRSQFEVDIERVVGMLETQSMEEFASVYAQAPTRIAFKEKDPSGWELFRDQLGEHSTVGSANTMRGVQLKRPTIFDLESELTKLAVPALIVIGDEDEPCIDPAVFMRRKIPSSGLVVIPQSGHTINLEEPELFNQALRLFLQNVENGGWRTREQVMTGMLPPSE
jgi:pimeloyl-ACP methyl ester carboxylesterase